jgi:hypothetical protein
MQALVNPIGPLEMAVFAAENAVKVDAPSAPSVVVNSNAPEVKAEEAVSTMALATDKPAVIQNKSVGNLNAKANTPAKKLDKTLDKKLSAAQLKKQSLLKKQEAARKNALAWKAKQAAKRAKMKAEKLALAKKKQAEQKKLALAKKQALLKKQSSLKKPVAKAVVAMPAVESVTQTEVKKPEAFESIDLTPPEPSALLQK